MTPYHQNQHGIEAVGHPMQFFPDVREIGREKLEVFLSWLGQRLEAEDDFKLIVWCRFRPELFRVIAEINRKFPKVITGKLWGDQKRSERDETIALLTPESMPKDPVVVAGTPSTGSMGLTLTGARACLYISNDYNLKTRKQSEDRPHRPGQLWPVWYGDIVAEGPKGQKTIDHHVVHALQSRNDLAQWTVSAWLDVLKEE